MILAHIHSKSSQAKFPRILIQNGQNDLEGQVQLPSFLISAESIRECMFGANLVIRDDLSCEKGKVYGQTDRHRQEQYPFGLKGQAVIKTLSDIISVENSLMSHYVILSLSDETYSFMSDKLHITRQIVQLIKIFEGSMSTYAI